MGLRVASWNINHRGRSVADTLGGLLRAAAVDLVCLQEANPSSLEALRLAAGLDWYVTALDAGVPGPVGRSGRRRVAAIAGRGAKPPAAYMSKLALPERFVFVQVDTALGPLTVASYHAPPGVNWGVVKVDHAHALADWVDRTAGRLVVGADANTPLVDHPDPDQVRTHWHTGDPRLDGGPGDDVVFGGHPRHRLRDAYRLWLDDHPEVLDAIVQERPDGPLAVSHRTGKRRDFRGAPRGFDALWVSPNLRVDWVGYDYDNAVTAGTDLALVVAALEPLRAHPAQ